MHQREFSHKRKWLILQSLQVTEQTVNSCRGKQLSRCNAETDFAFWKSVWSVRTSRRGRLGSSDAVKTSISRRRLIKSELGRLRCFKSHHRDTFLMCFFSFVFDVDKLILSLSLCFRTITGTVKPGADLRSELPVIRVQTWSHPRLTHNTSPRWRNFWLFGEKIALDTDRIMVHNFLCCLFIAHHN